MPWHVSRSRSWHTSRRCSLNVLELRPNQLLPDAVKAATAAVRPDHCKVVDAVLQAVDGWESTYELELLATTLFTFDEGTATTAAQAHEVISGWSQIPAHLFTTRHVAIAWDHLRATGWLADSVLTS